MPPEILPDAGLADAIRDLVKVLRRPSIEPELLGAKATALLCGMSPASWHRYVAAGLVRSAVVWAGMPDPGATRLLLQETADITAGAMAVLLGCWLEMDPNRRGLTTAEAVCRLREPPGSPPDYYADMRDAVEALAGRLDARLLGYQLRRFRRRIFGGQYLDVAGTQRRAARWVVRPAVEFHSRPAPTGEDGEDVPAGTADREIDEADRAAMQAEDDARVF
jgi:hypothetical protein